MPKEENNRTVRQKDADELHATITPAPTAPPTTVTATDLDIRDLSKLQDEIYAILKTDAGVAYDARDIRPLVYSTDSIEIIDSGGRGLTFRQENENWNAADRGILMFGRDMESTPNKYRAMRLDAAGHVAVSIHNPAHDQFEFNTEDFNTGGGTDNISVIGLALPGGSGAVIAGTATNPLRVDVTGTTTQPVSATNLDIRDLAKAQDEIYTVLKTDAGAAYDARDRSWTITESIPVTGTFWQVTQPVSGTVTANAGTNLNTSSLLTESDFDTRMGEVQVTPTAYTVLSRLKSIADGQLADGHNVTVDNASIAVTGTFWQSTQPVSGTVTVTDISDIRTAALKIVDAVEKIDNQEDSILYRYLQVSTLDADVIAAPGAGYFLRVHHMYVNNVGANVTTFDIEDGTTTKWRFCLAAIGGAVAQNLKRPWDLAENSPLHYDYGSGLLASISITIGYETIAV